jgi:hypothetical protein
MGLASRGFFRTAYGTAGGLMFPGMPCEDFFRQRVRLFRGAEGSLLQDYSTFALWLLQSPRTFVEGQVVWGQW